MKSTLTTKAVEYVVALKMKAIDKWVEQMVEPLEEVGSPEKLIKKPFEQWDENDLALLTKIYGMGKNTPLERTIFNRTLERVERLEQEEAM